MDDREFMDLVKKNKERKETSKENYDTVSKDRLKKIGQSKIKTTMIGSLDLIEKTFGFLWGLDENGKDSGEPLSDEQEYMRELYETLRTEILDNGNRQIRNLDSELQQYTVTWNRYHKTMPVIPEGPKGGVSYGS